MTAPELSSIANVASDTVSVVAVDDHPVIREALQDLIEQDMMGFAFRGYASTADEGLTLIKDEHPDVAVLDLSLEKSSGMDLLRAVQNDDDLNTEVIIYSVHRGTLHAERALRAGARGYVRKRHSLSTLKQALQDVSEGMLYLDEEVEDQVFDRLIGSNGKRSGFLLDLLTDREMTVFRMLGRGQEVDDIAGELDVAPKTIETYRRRARKKLGLDTTNQLLQFAIHWVETGGDGE